MRSENRFGSLFVLSLRKTCESGRFGPPSPTQAKHGLNGPPDLFLAVQNPTPAHQAFSTCLRWYYNL
jgi:hypothetical protein